MSAPPPAFAPPAAPGPFKAPAAPVAPGAAFPGAAPKSFAPAPGGAAPAPKSFAPAPKSFAPPPTAGFGNSPAAPPGAPTPSASQQPLRAPSSSTANAPAAPVAAPAGAPAFKKAAAAAPVFPAAAPAPAPAPAPFSKTAGGSGNVGGSPVAPSPSAFAKQAQATATAPKSVAPAPGKTTAATMNPAAKFPAPAPTAAFSSSNVNSKAPPVPPGGGAFPPTPAGSRMPSMAGGAPSPSPARPPGGGGVGAAPFPAPFAQPQPPPPGGGGATTATTAATKSMPPPAFGANNKAPGGFPGGPLASPPSFPGSPSSLGGSSPITTGTPASSNANANIAPSAQRAGSSAFQPPAPPGGSFGAGAPRGSGPGTPTAPHQQQQQHQHQQYQQQQPNSTGPAGFAPPPGPGSQQQHLQKPATPTGQQGGGAQSMNHPPSHSSSAGNQQQQQQQQQNATGPATSSTKNRMRAKPQGNNRIDSLQMPSPCRDLLVDGHPSYVWPPTPFVTSKSSVPPTHVSGTPYVDEGNAAARFMRPTLHQLPFDDAMLEKAQTPWGCVLSPLSNASSSSSAALPVVQLGETSPTNNQVVAPQAPIRCDRCRAYMNPWNPFGGSGHSWGCSFCGMNNEVGESYYSPMNNNGKRRDALDRPELCRGSYEIDVTDIEKYWAENPDTQTFIKPKPMNHLFIIDVSKGTAASILPSLITAIREAVEAMPNSGFGACCVSFVTYATTLHFYDFSDPRMPQMVVPDVANPFVPLPFNLLCWMNVEKDADRIHAFLDLLQSGEIANTVDESGCAVGAAAKVGQLILSDVGGKVILTATNSPNIEESIGTFKERNVGVIYGSKNEHELFKPQPGFWPDLALESAKRHVSFDLFMFASGHCDMVTLGQLCHMTNGKQWLFFNFRDDSDGLRLKRRVLHALNDEAGYGAILRIRCSAGIRVKSYHGHFTQTNMQDMDLAGVDSSSTFYTQFTHDAQLEKKGTGIVQCALLYTSRAGRRKVCIHTLRMTVADTISTLFRYTDLEATLHAFLCLGIHEAFNKGIKAARDFIIAQTVSLLVGYRKHSQSGSHSGQLLLPENLKLLPLYNLCLMKSDALSSGTVVRLDDRIQNMFELLTYPQDRLLFYMYPRMFALHMLLGQAGEYKISDDADNDDDGSGGVEEQRPQVFLPCVLQLTADNVYQGGIYCLQDLQARIVFLLIGSTVKPDVLRDTFGLSEGEPTSKVTQASMDQWNPRVRRIVQQVMDETGRLAIVREKQDVALEDAFFRNLLEDEGPNKETCYSEFLCSLHKQINAKSR